MYRGSGFNYGFAPRRRRPMHMQGHYPGMRYGDPYFDGDPYAGMGPGPMFDPYYCTVDPYDRLIMGNYPRHRMPPPPHMRPRHVSDWENKLVQRQINRAQQKIMAQSKLNNKKPKEVPNSGQKSALKTESADKAAATSQTDNKSLEQKSENQKEIVNDSKPVEENNNPTPPIPIGPRISAKQMWESSYAENIKEEQAAAKNEPPPGEKTIATDTTPVQVNKKTNKRGGKNRNGKFRRGPYYKRKKKQTATSESTLQEPGFGFDVDGRNTTEATNKNGETSGFPKICKICTVQLLSQEQADVHYKGETHKKNINNFITGQDKQSIKTKLDKINESLPLPTNTPECLAWGPDTGDRTINTIRFCRLCSVRMSSIQNAKQHYEGKSHAKRIRLVQHGRRPLRKPFKPTAFISGGLLGVKSEAIIPAYSYNTVSNTFIQSQDPIPPTSSINLKPSLPTQFVYSMTPSGQYYCQTCNIVIQYAGELNQHLQSKEHKLAKARS